MGNINAETSAAPPRLQNPPESLTDGVVTLRRWRPTDAADFCRVINSSRAEFAEWLPWAREQYKLEHAVAFMDRKARGWGEGFAWSYAITRADDQDRVLGSADVGCYEEPGGLSMGYWLATEYLGRGYATRAAALLTQTAFEDMGARVVRIVHDVANLRSARVPERLGFVRVREFQPPPGDENVDDRPDVEWLTYPEHA